MSVHNRKNVVSSKVSALPYYTVLRALNHCCKLCNSSVISSVYTMGSYTSRASATRKLISLAPSPSEVAVFTVKAGMCKSGVDPPAGERES